MRIVETDNFGRDYPNESFLRLPSLREEAAEAICKIINHECAHQTSDRYWVVVEDDYILQPGFEP